MEACLPLACTPASGPPRENWRWLSRDAAAAGLDGRHRFITGRKGARGFRSGIERSEHDPVSGRLAGGRALLCAPGDVKEKSGRSSYDRRRSEAGRDAGDSEARRVDLYGRVMERGGRDGEARLANAAVRMHGRRGNVEGARAAFDEMLQRDLLSWNIMIATYTQNGYDEEAVELFGQMQVEGMQPDEFTFTPILGACANLGAVEDGRLIHARIIAGRLESNVVAGNALINMYGKCGSLMDARAVFDRMCERNVVSWNAVIAAYTQNGYGMEALELFQQMTLEGVKPSKITFLSILDACGGLVSLSRGRAIHSLIFTSGFESDIVVENALVNMYSKCGSLRDARAVFDRMHRRNVVSWTAMIGAYAQNGHGKEVPQLIRQMKLEGVKPNKVTFVSILNACSHAGLLDEGQRYFDSMSTEFGITPIVEHYGCMVDLLGRAGRLDEAEDLINSMPFQPDAVVWRVLLAACKVHGDVERGTRAAERVLELDPTNDAPYIVLSNIYAAAGRWDDIVNVRKCMEIRGVKKHPGYSWIEVNDRVHGFVVGDTSHPQSEEIFAELQRLSKQMEEAGYTPDTRSVLHDVEEEEKQHLLLYHSEKLAIAFGLITAPRGMPLRVVKNLRVCSDCHAATKFISSIVGREIIVRDSNCFHHFKHGVCSCGDYW